MTAPTGQTFELRTVADFMALPADRRDVAIREFRHYAGYVAAVESINDLCGAEAIKPLPGDVFHWIDDDKGEARINITAPNGAHASITLSTKE